MAVSAEPDVEVRVVSQTLDEIRADIEAVSLALGLQGDSLDEADLTAYQRHIVVADDFDSNGIVVKIDPRAGDVPTIVTTIRSLVAVPTDIRVESMDLSLDCTPLACGLPLRGGIKVTTIGCTVSQSAAAYDTYLCHTGQKLYDDTGSAQSCGRLIPSRGVV